MGRTGTRCIAGCSAVMALALAGPLPAAKADAVATAAADGIRATLTADHDAATVDWRFLHRPPAPINGVTVLLNGRALAAPRGSLAPLPAPGQTIAVLCLTDASAASPKAIQSRLAALPAGDGLLLQTVRFGDGRTAASSEGQPWPTDLASALERGIADLAARPADRRVLLVVTDGFTSTAIPTDLLAAHALAANVALVFALIPGARLGDAAAIGRLAERTGGRLVRPEEDLATALRNGVLSGAIVHFPFGNARRYFWERHATVTAQIDYGAQILDLSTEVDLPAAGPSETLAMVWRRVQRRLPAFLGGIVVTLIAMSVFKRRPHATA